MEKGISMLGGNMGKPMIGVIGSSVFKQIGGQGGDGASFASVGRLDNTHGTANNGAFSDVTRGSEGGRSIKGHRRRHPRGDVNELGDSSNGFGDAAGLTGDAPDSVDLGGAPSMPHVIDYWLGVGVTGKETASGDTFNNIGASLTAWALAGLSDTNRRQHQGRLGDALRAGGDAKDVIWSGRHHGGLRQS
ncbi:unnamed protein product [Ilex paraguariensis]|uniref:Uncharacterized protein n=1 Tax=Ilex paraguariensis TaxID=185542 RepID=A0ABC8QW03_9AQUA